MVAGLGTLWRTIADFNIGNLPVLADLFCGAGGSGRGYQQAGFFVVGVDIKAQPRYAGDVFVQDDALTFPLEEFDAVHASPVCKRWSRVTRTSAVDPESHPDQIAVTRERLIAWGGPWIIENVPEAPLIDPVLLCGSMFDLDVKRHRHFENNWNMPNHMWPCRHRIWHPQFAPNRSDRRRNPLAQASVVTVAGGGGGGTGTRVADWRRAMQIDWMIRDELAQAIPPAYTEWIGSQLLEVVR
jgi:DNA (cytosine-5)-methyltransferase 1